MTQNEDRWNHDRVIISFSSTWVSKINQRTVHLEWASKVVKNKKKWKKDLRKKKRRRLVKKETSFWTEE